MLEVDQVHYHYPDADIDADFHIAEGEALALMGPSGCGKSTVLALIAGFLDPLEGDIRFQGRSLLPLKPADRPLTQLFQAHNLFPHLRVWQNLGLGIDPGLKLDASQHQRIEEALEQVGLGGFARRMPDELSGGQQQRVALARCLLRDRPLLLLDEPFSALDTDTRQEMIGLIDSVRKRLSLTLLLTTHLQQDAIAPRRDGLSHAPYQCEGDVTVAISCCVAVV